MKQKIFIADLKLGMYVSELDRPWLDSPFLFQGFLIEDKEQVYEIRKTCEFVFVDEEKSVIPIHASSKSSAQGRDNKAETPPLIHVQVEDEFIPAQQLRKDISRTLDKIFTDVRKGNRLDIGKAENSVSEMIESIMRNPNAMLLVGNLRSKDEFAESHAINVAVLTIFFGSNLGLPKKVLQELGLGALLHDIGEIIIPNEILAKGSRLKGAEFQIMKTHTEKGAELLSHADDIPKSAIDIAHSHHERINGSGYPRGIQGSEMSYFSKIVSLVDFYDAITAPRAGRAINSVDALKHIYNWRDKLFDPDLVEHFIQCIGIYPVGSMVELGTGEVGIVISIDQEKRLLPKLLLVRDEEKQPYYPPHIFNMALLAERAEHVPEIKHILKPGDYGVDIKNYLLKENFAR